MNTNKDKVLYLTGEIDGSSIKTINTQLLQQIKEDNKQDQTLKAFNREPIELYINSFGGSVYDALSLVDIIIHSPTPIHTVCTGYAMSAAFLVFISGSKRFLSPHATLMYHQISQNINGKLGHIETSLAESKRLEQVIDHIITEKTKIPLTMLEEHKKNQTDWYISLEEALELGCVDETLVSI